VWLVGLGLGLVGLVLGFGLELGFGLLFGLGKKCPGGECLGEMSDTRLFGGQKSGGMKAELRALDRLTRTVLPNTTVSFPR